MLGFGPHRVYDAHGCPTARLSDLDSLYRLLENLPDRVREFPKHVGPTRAIVERDRQRVAREIGLEALR